MKKQICQINTDREEQHFLSRHFQGNWKLLKLKKKTADHPCFVFFLIYDRENKNASA
jgi:hypothetical protein